MFQVLRACREQARPIPAFVTLPYKEMKRTVGMAFPREYGKDSEKVAFELESGW